MPRGNAGQTIVHYKGQNEDYIVFVESPQMVDQWRKDKSTPLAQVVDGYKVFVTHKHGNQGILDTASNGQLDSEFGGHKDDDVIAQIIEKGTCQEHEEQGRPGDKNPSKGPSVAH